MVMVVVMVKLTVMVHTHAHGNNELTNHVHVTIDTTARTPGLLHATNVMEVNESAKVGSIIYISS